MSILSNVTASSISPPVGGTPKPQDVGFDAKFNPNDWHIAEHDYFPVERKIKYIEYVLLTLVAANILGLGGQVNGETLFKLIQSPLLLTCGMVIRLAIMPAILLGLTSLLHIDSSITLASLCLLTSPSEGASCLLVLLAEADVDLCFALVACNAFTTTAVTPLWAILFEKELYGYAGELAIPFTDMFLMFTLVVCAGIMGYILREKHPASFETYWCHLPICTAIAMVGIIASEFYCNFHIFPRLTTNIIILAVSMAAISFAIAAFISYILCLNCRRTLTMILEIGVRTSYVANLCATMTYKQPAKAKSAAVLCSLLSLVPTFIIIMAFRIRKRIQMIHNKRHKDTEIDSQTQNKIDEID